MRWEVYLGRLENERGLQTSSPLTTVFILSVVSTGLGMAYGVRPVFPRETRSFLKGDIGRTFPPSKTVTPPPPTTLLSAQPDQVGPLPSLEDRHKDRCNHPTYFEPNPQVTRGGSTEKRTASLPL